MKPLIALSLLVLLAGCSGSRHSSRQRVPLGAHWIGEEQYGYRDVFVGVEKLPVPFGGSTLMHRRIREALHYSPCSEMDRLAYAIVIDQAGRVVGVHSPNVSGEACEYAVARALADIRFQPALLRGEAVASVISQRITLRMATQRERGALPGSQAGRMNN